MPRKRIRWPKVHIICSGGGTKGAAQSGSLEAITELIGYADAYSGASVGAINAAWYALEKDPKQLRKLWRELRWYDIIAIPWHDIVVLLLSIAGTGISVIQNIPWVGIASTAIMGLKLLTKRGLSSDANLKKLLIKYFGDAKLGDVKHRLVIKATDITTATSIQYDSNNNTLKDLKIVDLLLESARFPVVYEPKVEKASNKSGAPLVIADGGILDNVPCDIGKEYDSNIILWLGYMGKPSVFKIAWYRIVFKVIDAMMSEDARESLVRIKTKHPLIIKYPFLYQRGTFDFRDLDGLYQKGYDLVISKFKDKVIEAKNRYVH